MNTVLEGVHSAFAPEGPVGSAGTMCGGEIQGSFAQKYKDCGYAIFITPVREEEGDDFILPIDLLGMIQISGQETLQVFRTGKPTVAP